MFMIFVSADGAGQRRAVSPININFTQRHLLAIGVISVESNGGGCGRVDVDVACLTGPAASYNSKCLRALADRAIDELVKQHRARHRQRWHGPWISSSLLPQRAQSRTAHIRDASRIR